MSKAYKGADFERDVCRRLSLWWTGGARDDIFWRTSISGGRATVRAAKGKTTFGQYGDIHAVDSIGSPLTSRCCIELKRGYSGSSLIDIIDKRPVPASHPWIGFLRQAEEQAMKARIPYWLLITRRDRCIPLIFGPSKLFRRIFKEAGWEDCWCPVIEMRIDHWDTPVGRNLFGVCGMSLDDFFDEIHPSAFNSL